MSGKIWIDLTDMLEWNGHFGGTQRVVYGIAREYYDAAQAGRHEVGLLACDSLTKKFYEADFATIIARKVAIDTKQASSSSGISVKDRLRHEVVSRTPSFITSNPKVKAILRTAARQSYRTLRSARHIIKNTVASQSGTVSTKEQVEFKNGDTILLLGKPWDNPAMMPTLEKSKEASSIRIFTVIYDLVITLYPHLQSPSLYKDYTQYLFYAATVSDGILPISQSSESDFYEICVILSLPSPKSTVIRLGDDASPLISHEAPRIPQLKDSEPFLLCVGTIEVRKNHALLYYVYKLAQQRGINLPKLVIVGRLGWHANDIYMLMKNDPQTQDRIIILESVSDSELTWLYSNCLFTVYPSMYEGWGLTVAESMQQGKIAIATDQSSVPEIAGDLLEYFSPYSADECLRLIVKYLDENKRTGRERLIASKYSSTSWQDTYKKVCEAMIST